MRLQQYLAQSGVASRRSAERLIIDGKVRVNGVAVSTLGTQVNARNDRVEVEGRRVRPEAPLYRLLLKPRSCLSTLVRAEDNRPTLLRFVSDPQLGWKVVAPLDFPAEGVVLLTTDGELAERMSRGGGKVPMTYHLKLQGSLGAQELERLRKGWKWNNRPVRPLAVEALATTGKNTWIEMVVPESRPRVLKAAGELMRHTLLKISRVRMGPVSFEGLKMGEARDLTKSEVTALRRAAGIETDPKNPTTKPGKG
jgi:23S rRNA pseudouridine2605 synthase